MDDDTISDSGSVIKPKKHNGADSKDVYDQFLDSLAEEVSNYV
jgi:hypothetical protein